MEISQPRSKYGNKKTVVDGIQFDSKREASVYQELLICKKAQKPEDRVVDIELQPEFILQDAFDHQGKKIRKIIYRSDFRVKYADGHEEILDAKGFRTDVYRIKKKLFLKRYPEIIFIEI